MKSQHKASVFVACYVLSRETRLTIIKNRECARVLGAQKSIHEHSTVLCVNSFQIGVGLILKPVSKEHSGTFRA